MSFDNMEEGTPCDFCGQPVEFSDDDWVRCSKCGAEYSSMDYTGDEIIEEEWDRPSNASLQNAHSAEIPNLFVKFNTGFRHYQLMKMFTP